MILSSIVLSKKVRSEIKVTESSGTLKISPLDETPIGRGLKILNSPTSIKITIIEIRIIFFFFLKFIFTRILYHMWSRSSGYRTLVPIL